MPTLSDRLKSLGVQVGADALKPARETRDKSVRRHLGGELVPTARGEAYVVERRHPAGGGDYPAALWGNGSLEMLAAWAREPGVAGLEREKFAFLDTETTGLSGGAGTFAFMVGIGKFEGDVFRLAQFFLREPGEEPAQLAAIEGFLAGSTAIVSFNGKAFDAPVVNTRYALHRQPSPLDGLAHLDLLHLARRLWKLRLSSRRLGDLETGVLGIERGAEDIPGFLVPQMYLDYLKYGDAEPLKGVFYHNEWDVLSMAALMTHMAELLSNPVEATRHDLDLLSIGVLHEDLGRVSEAQALYLKCLGRPLEQGAWLEAARRLSFVYKKTDDWESAVKLWRTAAGKGELYAHEELAKYHEHRTRDLAAALEWTRSALDRIESQGFPIIQRFQWQGELEKRLARLEQKMRRMGE
ncbi:MAG TPA: ribonuclease H-like domain-containing protein [Anaerolineales bacterium]|nr:ribonuclease H-like domain-containing protein [Anaerolineales bacterium]